jgi:chemotaxis protein MotA
MDIATGLGLVAGFGTLIALIMIDGGNFGQYWDKHAAIVIFGGSFAVTLIRFPFSSIAHGLPLGIRFAFQMRAMDPRALIEEITRVAEVVRKSGPIALENIEIEDPFMAQGVRYIADGYDAEFIRGALERDRDVFLMHLEEGQKIYRSVGDCAPAWGMVGTLIGMVNMFANMEDPSKLGPFMAVALLATLYGALVGNLICLPIADKLMLKLEEEEVSRTLIIDGILQVRDAKSPGLVREMLLAYLPEKQRAELAEGMA